MFSVQHSVKISHMCLWIIIIIYIQYFFLQKCLAKTTRYQVPHCAFSPHNYSLFFKLTVIYTDAVINLVNTWTWTWSCTHNINVILASVRTITILHSFSEVHFFRSATLPTHASPLHTHDSGKVISCFTAPGPVGSISFLFPSCNFFALLQFLSSSLYTNINIACKRRTRKSRSCQ